LSSFSTQHSARSETPATTDAAQIRYASTSGAAASTQPAADWQRLSAVAGDGLATPAVAGKESAAAATSTGPGSHRAAFASVAAAAGQGAATGVPTPARLAAFDEIGRDGRSLLQSLSADPWHRTVTAAPLLLVLALERIATGNSRRNRRDAAAQPVQRPRRP
jgi:hypothetical protein